LLPARVIQTGKVLRNNLYVNDIEHVRVSDCDGEWVERPFLLWIFAF